MIATAFHYWISPSLVNTQLNVDGIHNRVMINIDAKALLYVCIPDTVNKIKVTNAITKKDEEHFQSFKLRSLDVVIPDNNPRYVYAVVPKTSYTANEELDALPTPPQAYLTLLTGKVNIDGTSSGGVSTPSEYPTTSYHYIYLGGMIGASETNGTLHERYWQETLATGSLSQVADALPSQYWIKNGAINITLNALGEPDKISASVASNAVIMAYIPGYDTLGYDSAHNYRRWQLAAYPTAFGDAQQKYIYIAIPRAVSSGSAAADTAYLVFPSQRIGIDGKNQIGEQIGSTQYYYIWLRASISSSGKNGTTARYWLDEDGNKAVDANDTPYCPINFGSLSTDDSSTNGSESEWWQYNPVTKLVTFLKTIATAAFNYLFAKKADITTLNVTEETVTTQQVVDHTDWGQYTADASGATVRRDASGNWLIETDYLKVRKKATFTNVEIQDVYHVGGQMMLTSASCRVDLVDEVKDETGAVTGYRIYFKKTDSSGQRVDNTWKAGDQAYCNTFDLTNNREALNYSGTQSNHFVWRLVTALNNYPTIKTWSEVKNKAVTGAIKPYVDLATQVKQGTATLQKFIDEWNTLLEETKYIRDDAKTYLAASYLVDVNNAMTKVADSINAVLADDSELVLNYQFSSDLINNGIIAYASELDKLRRLYLTTVYHTLVLSNVRNDQTLGYAEGSDKPRVGDNFVQLGYRKQASESQDDDAVKNRQGALILAGAGANAPYIYMFKNIGRKWSEAKAKTELGETVWASKVAAGTSTAFLDGTYFVLPTPYMQFSPAKTVINATDVIKLSTGSEDEDYDDDNPNSINSIFNSYSNRLDAVEEAVDDISDQTDGSFRIWQGENFKAGDDLEGQPIYPSHFPSNGNVIDGTKDEKGDYVIVSGWEDANLAERVDDFYVATDGLVWQFKYDATTGYKWDAVADEYLVAFVNQIKEKKRVFLLKDANGNPITTDTDVALYFNGDGASAHPARNYEIGDLWVSAYYYLTSEGVVTEKSYDNDSLVCIKNKNAATGFQITDWAKDNGYGDRINEAMEFINNISSDNVITYGEKYSKDPNCLTSLFDKVVTTRNTFYNITDDDGTPVSGTLSSGSRKYSMSYTEYEAAYSNLFSIMLLVFGITDWKGSVSASTKNDNVYQGTIKLVTTIPSDATAVTGFDNKVYLGTDGNYYITPLDDDSTFNFYWSHYYDEELSMQEAVTSYVVETTDETCNRLDAMANDKVIALDEHSDINEENVIIEREHTNIVAYAVSLAASYSAAIINSNGTVTDNTAKTNYNTFAQAYNSYQQAYLDYHAIADIILHSTNNLVFVEGMEEYGLTGVNDTVTNYQCFFIDKDTFISGKDEEGNDITYNYVVNTENANANNLVSKCIANETTGLYALNSITNTNVSFASSYGALGRWVLSRDTYLSVVAGYKDKLMAIQNEISKVSQILSEEDVRAYAQSILGATTADNILTANEKRAICQELNSIGADMQYAVEKAIAVLVSKENPTEDDITEPASSTDTALYNARLKVYQAYKKMRLFFNILAGGSWKNKALYVGDYDYYVENGIAKAIGISRAHGAVISQLMTFTADTVVVDGVEIIPTFDLTNLFYRVKADPTTATGAMSSGEVEEDGGVIEDDYNTLYSDYRWYVGRDGKCRYDVNANFQGTTPSYVELVKNTFLDAFNDYYAAANNFSNAVIAYNKYIADKAKETADGADTKADEALKTVHGAVSDALIMQDEKTTIITPTWSNIYNIFKTIKMPSNPDDRTEKEKALVTAYSGVSELMGFLHITTTDASSYLSKTFYLMDYTEQGNTPTSDMIPLSSTGSTTKSDITRETFISIFTAWDEAYAAYVQKIEEQVIQSVDDKLIEQSEKIQKIETRWLQIKAAYDEITDKTESLTAAYNAVAAMMGYLGYNVSTGVFNNLSTTYWLYGYKGDKEGLIEMTDGTNTITREKFIKVLNSDWDAALQAYQDAHNATINEANINAANALTATGAIANDGIISAGTEKQLIYQIYSQIKTTVSNYVNQCKSYGITYASGACTYAQNANDNVKALGAKLITYVTAYNTLDIYLTGHEEGQLNLFGYTSGSSVVGGFLKDTKLSDCNSNADAFRTAFQTYYSAESTFADALEEFKKDQLAEASIDMVGGSINISATSNISIASEKVKIGDSTLGEWFTFAGGTLTGNGIKMQNGNFNGSFKVGGDGGYIEMDKWDYGAKMNFHVNDPNAGYPNDVGFIEVSPTGLHTRIKSQGLGDIFIGDGAVIIGENSNQVITLQGGSGMISVKFGTNVFDLVPDDTGNILQFKKRSS